MPKLNEESEELQMLLEVAEIVANARMSSRQRGGDLSPSDKGNLSGRATENVIRDHLLRKCFKLSKTRVQISPLSMEIDLLQLKLGADPMKMTYLPEEVVTVFEIKNNAVTDQATKTKTNFDRLKSIVRNARFAFVVLSERISYSYRVTPKELQYPVYELISRRRSAGHWMESRSEIIAEYRRITSTGERAMWETGEWNKLINDLSSKSG